MRVREPVSLSSPHSEPGMYSCLLGFDDDKTISQTKAKDYDLVALNHRFALVKSGKWRGNNLEHEEPPQILRGWASDMP